MKNFLKRSLDNERERIKGWKIVYKGFNPSVEKLRETLCTLGNGYMGVRGSATESSASKSHYPGIYIAGIYNTLATDVSGKKIFNEEIPNRVNEGDINLEVDKDEPR